MDVKSAVIGAYILILFALNAFYIINSSEDDGEITAGFTIFVITVISTVLITLNFK